MSDKIDFGVRLKTTDIELSSHLAELMRYQLLLAASWQQRDPETAFDIGAYVLKITQKIPGAIELFTRALKFATVPGMCMNCNWRA